MLIYFVFKGHKNRAEGYYHLKNFIMLGGGGAYIRAPALDLLPDTENRHGTFFHFTYNYYCPGKMHLAEFGKRLGVSKTALVVNEIPEMVDAWQNEFKAFAVPESEIENLSAGIAGQLTEGELEKDAVVWKFRTTAADGKS